MRYRCDQSWNGVGGMWTFPPLSDPSIGMVTMKTWWKPTGVYTGIYWLIRFLSLRGPNIILPANPNLEPRPWIPQSNHFVREMGKLEILLHRYHAIALLSSMDCSGFRTWRLFLIVMGRPNCLCACLTCFSVPMSRDSRTAVVIFAINEVLGQLLTSPTCCLSLESSLMYVSIMLLFLWRALNFSRSSFVSRPSPRLFLP